MECKLDIVLYNSNWLEFWEQTDCLTHPRHFSDHNPLFFFNSLSMRIEAHGLSYLQECGLIMKILIVLLRKSGDLINQQIVECLFSPRNFVFLRKTLNSGIVQSSGIFTSWWIRQKRRMKISNCSYLMQVTRTNYS